MMEFGKQGMRNSKFTEAQAIHALKRVGIGAYVDELPHHWITLHEVGNVAGFTPVLVMDVWEHAFLLDYKPADRPKYIEAFFSNVDWRAVESRLARTRQAAAA